MSEFWRYRKSWCLSFDVTETVDVWALTLQKQLIKIASNGSIQVLK